MTKSNDTPSLHERTTKNLLLIKHYSPNCLCDYNIAISNDPPRRTNRPLPTTSMTISRVLFFFATLKPFRLSNETTRSHDTAKKWSSTPSVVGEREYQQTRFLRSRTLSHLSGMNANLISRSNRNQLHVCVRTSVVSILVRVFVSTPKVLLYH